MIGAYGVGVFNGFVKVIMENWYCSIRLKDIDEIFTTLKCGCMDTTIGYHYAKIKYQLITGDSVNNIIQSKYIINNNPFYIFIII